MQTADIGAFASPSIEKQANLQLSLNVQKLKVFWLQKGFASWHPDHASVPLSFGYCSINTVLLLYDVVYTISDICTIGFSGVAKGDGAQGPNPPKHKHTYKLHKICQFGQFIFGKIIKIVATRFHFLKLKCTRFDFG